MFYAFTAILVIISCILQGMFYHDVRQSQDSNFTKIVSMWEADPINQVALLTPGKNCPDGLQVYDQSLIIPQSSDLCSCETKGSQFSSQSNQAFEVCGQCPDDQVDVMRFEGIPEKNLNDQFYVQDFKGKIVKYRVCVSRIKDYSFIKKAPSSVNCESDEQICSWLSSSNPEYNYCIPKQNTCYSEGVNIPNQNFYLQLPLIDIKNNTYNFQILNFLPGGEFTLQQIYDLNNINYQKQFIPFFSSTPIYNQILVTYPQVKMTCRSSFKASFASYSGQDYGLKIAIALVIVTAVTALMAIVHLYYDMIDFYLVIIKKKEAKVNYWSKKRFRLQNTAEWNTFIIVKPLIFIISFILYILVCQNYLVAPLEMKKLIHNQCVDISLEYLFNYFSDYSQSDLPRESLVYAALVFQIFAFFSDQVVIQAFNYLAHKLGVVKLINKITSSKENKQQPIQILPIEMSKEIKENQQQEKVKQEMDVNQTQQMNEEIQNKIESLRNQMTPQNTGHTLELENIEHNEVDQKVEQINQTNGIQIIQTPQPYTKTNSNKDIKLSQFGRQQRTKSIRENDQLLQINQLSKKNQAS